MKITVLRKYGLLVLSAFVIWSCRPDNNPVAPQTEWLERTDGFQEKYELEQLLSGRKAKYLDMNRKALHLYF